MASNVGWNTNVPSAQSPARLGEQDIRSVKTFLQNWLEEEHYVVGGSANSAGVHRPGSARAFQGPASQLSNPQSGRLFHDPGNNLFYISSATTWRQLPAGITSDSNNTWTALQAYQRNNTNQGAFNTRAAGDAFARLSVVVSGAMQWGPGSSGTDVALHRGGAGRLEVDGSLTVLNNFGVDGTVRVGTNGTPVARLLSASTSVDLPSMTSQTFSNFTLAVPGAVVGNLCIVNNPVLADSFDLQTAAHVSAAGVVQVVVKNDGLAATVDPAARNFRVLVLQF